MIKHRLDIDGLRAFAIIPVVLFHAGWQSFPGGYIGVDVFFTISGFLITSIILEDIKNNTFSYIAFFKRRIRRLLPMAMLINVLVLLCFYFYYPSVYYSDVAKAALASLFFVSNIFFWKEGGDYFGRNLEINPLLHTWSLAVEEQFYLVFPFLLILLFWIARNVVLKFVLFSAGIAVSIYFAVSFAPSIESVAAFYLLPPRMYELAIGALIALWIFYWPQHQLRDAKYLQEVGLLLIIIPVFLYDENTPFPSYYALLPCVGAAAVMFSKSSKGIAGKILCSKIFVFVGLISYSLYLWHWPLIVLKNWVIQTESKNYIVDFFVILAAIALSYLTYKYVESPFRNKSLVTDKLLLKWTGVGFVSIAALTITMIIFGNSRFVDPTGKINSTYQKAIQATPYRLDCLEKVRRSSQFLPCTLPGNNSSKGKRIFVWGDSHGSAFMPTLEKIAEKNQVQFANNSGCPPILNLKRTDLAQSCPEINQIIFDNIIEEQYDLVVFIAAYSNYLNMGLVGHLDATHRRNIEKSYNDFADLALKTIDEFEQRNVPFLIVVQPPRMKNSIPEEFLRDETLGKNYLGDWISLAQYEKQIEPLYEAIPEKWHKNMVSMPRVYCPEGRCISMIGRDLLFKDSHHISNHYADYLSDYFVPIFENMLARPLAN